MLGLVQASAGGMSQLAPLSLPSKSTLAASTIPAVVYLGYLMKSKYDQSYNNNSSSNRSSNNSNSHTFAAPQQSFNNFNSQLQEKLQKVQRSRLDPIEEEKEYWL